MKHLLLPFLALSIILFSCEEDEPIASISDETIIIIDNDSIIAENDSIIPEYEYPVKEYYLERNPSVNVWGAAIDFIHAETSSTETDLDYTYLVEDDTTTYDIKFYTVKEYYYTDNDELTSRGAPAILLSPQTKGYQVGVGIACFDSLTVITEDMIANLNYDPQLDYADFIDPTHGFYSQDLLAAAYESCLIGQSFRSDLLEVPEGLTEEEVQAVYLLQTDEGGYVKFMVRTFKPAKPNEKQTLVHWQVISE